MEENPKIPKNKQDDIRSLGSQLNLMNLHSDKPVPLLFNILQHDHSMFCMKMVKEVSEKTTQFLKTNSGKLTQKQLEEHKKMSEGKKLFGMISKYEEQLSDENLPEILRICNEGKIKELKEFEEELKKSKSS